MKPKESGGIRIRLYELIVILPLCCPALAWAQNLVSAQRDCDSPLIAAIHKRDLRGIRKIMDSGTDLNVKTCGEGETALTESIAEGFPEVAKQLVIAGANPNVADNRGVSPLMFAAWYCMEEVVSLLLRRGAVVNAADLDGDTALMHAASQCTNGKIVGILLEYGAAVNVIDYDGESALTIAAFNGDERAVKELVAAGADLNVRTGEGETALTIARDRQIGRKKSHDRIYAFLRGLTNH